MQAQSSENILHIMRIFQTNPPVFCRTARWISADRLSGMCSIPAQFLLLPGFLTDIRTVPSRLR